MERPAKVAVIHSFLDWVKGRANPLAAVQVFDRTSVFCSNSGFPESAPQPLRDQRIWASRRNLKAESIMKRTYQPSKIRRARTHGFLVRMKSRGGRAVINARRAKGRKKLSQV